MDRRTTCQICGREIKAKEGIIAHHGYQRPYKAGWQTNSCLGARFPPYETSRDRIPHVKNRLTNFLTVNRSALKELLDHPPEKMNIIIGGIYARKTIEVTRPTDYVVSKERQHCYSPRTYDYAFSNRRNELEQAIKEAQKDYDYLRNRYSTWKRIDDD